MPEWIKVIIVESENDMSIAIRRELESTDGIKVTGQTRTVDETLSRLSIVVPDIILLSEHFPEGDGVKLCERISLDYPAIGIVVLSEKNDLDRVRRFMRAGATDFLTEPLTIDDLIQTLHQVDRSQKVRFQRTTMAVLKEQSVHHPTVLLFSSPKGGVGKTTVATNFAVSLALQGKQTVLVDLDVQSGSISFQLNLTPQRNLFDLTEDNVEIDPDVVNSYLIRHNSGLSLLPAPLRAEDSERISPSDIKIVIDCLRRLFDYVIIDTSSTVNELLLSVLESSDECYMISNLNLTVLRANHMLENLIAELNIHNLDIRHIVNRSNEKTGIRVSDVERVLNGKVFAEIVDGGSMVSRSINEGVPLVVLKTKHKFSRSILNLTSKVIDSHGLRPSRKSILKRNRSSKDRTSGTKGWLSLFSSLAANKDPSINRGE